MNRFQATSTFLFVLLNKTKYKLDRTSIKLIQIITILYIIFTVAKHAIYAIETMQFLNKRPSFTTIRAIACGNIVFRRFRITPRINHFDPNFCNVSYSLKINAELGFRSGCTKYPNVYDNREVDDPLLIGNHENFLFRVTVTFVLISILIDAFAIT